MYIKDSSPPDIVSNRDRVILMRDRFESIKNNYAGMLYFCKRITGLDSPSMRDLETFEVARFHANEGYKKNLSFPIDYYLAKIKELEAEIARLKSVK